MKHLVRLESNTLNNVCYYVLVLPKNRIIYKMAKSQEQLGLMWQRTPVILRQEDHQVQTGLDNQVMTSSQQKKNKQTKKITLHKWGLYSHQILRRLRQEDPKFRSAWTT